MCLFDECKTCREYSKCPFLSGVVQRSYANGRLDKIYQKLDKIEKLLEILAGRS